MMIAKYIKNQLLKKGMDDVIVDVIKNEATQIKFSNNKIAKTGTEGIIDLSIFVAKDNKIITTSFKESAQGVIDNSIDIEGTNILRRKADAVIKKLVKFIEFAEPSKNYLSIAKGPFKYKSIKEIYDKKIKDVDEVDLVEKGINSALENAKRADGVLETYKGSEYLITSNNVEAKESFTKFYFSLRAFVDKEASGHMTTVSRVLNKFDVESVGKKAGEIAKMAVNPSKGVSGKFDVVFDHLPMAGLLSVASEAASIFNVESGMSFFVNKLGEKIGNFNLIDDGILSNGFGSTAFDNEGVPTKRTFIVKEGIFKTYLHNTSSAIRYNTKTTANAGLIHPTPWTIVLEGKKGNVFDIERGIYVTNLWYTRFHDYVKGDFSTIPRDGIFLIKNGEIIKPIKHIRISDNMLNLLKNIDVVSKEVRQIRSWAEAETPVVTPKVLVRNLNITKPTI